MQTPLKGKRGSQHGITIIELLITMIIMTVVSTMLIGGWISLQRSYAFTQRTNTARATTRDALDRVASELRAAQPPTTTTGATPFYFALTSPYVCGPNASVFYSAYNNSAAADGTGVAQVRLTAIWLDTSGSTAQKTLYWQRDTNNNGSLLDAVDRKIVLARNVVNGVYTGAAVSLPIFRYYFRDSTGVYTDDTSLTSTSVAALRSVQIELVVDANLAHTPSYVDLKTTVRPRSVAATN